MKPKASLKSLNVNFLLMASRPFTSLQPLSLARALWRAAPVNFSAMVRTSWSPRLCHESPCAGHSQRRPERLPNREQSRRLVCAEGPMSWSLTIGTIAGTAVRVHVTFLLFLGWIFAASWVTGGPEAAWQGLVFLVLLFACVVAHEFGHIFTARAFGVSTPDVTLLRTSQSEFPVVDAAGKPVGLLGRGDLIRALKQHGPDARVADAMSTTVPTISHRRCLEEAFRMLQEKSAPAVAVVDGNGRLVGLVTSETVGEMLMLHEALPKGARLGPWTRPTGA